MADLANNMTTTTEQKRYQIAGIFDTENLPWAEDIWDFTFRSIHEPWLQDLVPGLETAVGTGQLSPSDFAFTPLRNAACDSTTTVREYWKIREANGDIPPDAVIGCYCSGATMSLARIAGLESTPVVSPFSTSSQLSSTEEFPYFSRLLAPDDHRGEVAALVNTLQMFGWDRISILATDTQYAQDWQREFRHLWESEPIFGEVFYNTIIRTNLDGSVDETSARTALEGIPIDEPRINSRIILLAAHSQHAFPILKQAAEINNQPDTIWVGPSSWVGTDWSDQFSEGEYPGYLGAVPYQNEQGSAHQQFLEEFLSRSSSETIDWMEPTRQPNHLSLPNFAPQLVDSILATVLALDGGDPNNSKQHGSFTTAMRSLDFQGVSGRVQFTDEGDLKDPTFAIVQRQRWEWVSIGTTGIQSGSEMPSSDASFCFPVTGCVSSLSDVPDDSYPVPRTKLPVGAVVGIVLVVVALLAVAFKYWRSHRSKANLKREFKAFQESIVGMRTAKGLYIPTPKPPENSSTFAKGFDEEQPAFDRTSLTIQPEANVVWCWQETPTMMQTHQQEMIEGDPSDCWIKYSDKRNDVLEAAFQSGLKKCKPMKGYIVRFSSMKQTKKATGFERAVKRVVVDPSSAATVGSSFSANQPDLSKARTVDLSTARYGEQLPDDIRNEPQVVLIEGDIIQVSKQHDGGWAYGTKLHHQDEAMAREIVKYVTASTRNGDSSSDDETNILADTGWFQLDASNIPKADDLKVLQQAVGSDAGTLEPPSHWDPINDPTVVQLHHLKRHDPECVALVDTFRSTLGNHTVSHIRVDRIQKLAMWQSYVVKRRTICVRDIKQNKEKKKKGEKETKVHPDIDEAEQRDKAIQRFERCWLWHGTTADVKDKIMQQGFNRSFCGKNATFYGKGVYFARDASYSSNKLYSVPDPNNGNMQYILACRVVVGEYSKGVMNALTPNVRDVKTHTLYDSTVDDPPDPKIYVTYHDAQAYPEYLISFKQ